MLIVASYDDKGKMTDVALQIIDAAGEYPFSLNLTDVKTIEAFVVAENGIPVCANLVKQL